MTCVDKETVPEKKKALDEAYLQLMPEESPQMWSKRIGKPFSPDDLGKVWRGTYSYLDRQEVEAIRDPDMQDRRFTDHNLINTEPIQTMKFYHPSPSQRKQPNPLIFEGVLNSIKPYENIKQAPQMRGKNEHNAKVILQHSWPLEGIGMFESLSLVFEMLIFARFR
jgi:hypothetical protein